MRRVPLHCLVMLVGEQDFDLGSVFPKHECLLPTDIHRDLTNGRDCQGIQETIRTEMRHRALLKVKHGERAVVDARSFDKNQRIAFASAFSCIGVPVFYLVTDADRDLMRGDGIVEVIDAQKGVEAIQTLPQEPLQWLRSRFSGVTVIGDVHGMHSALQAAMAWARSRNHFIVFLGDVVDYGPGTLECMDDVYRSVMRNEAMFVIGNHERKIMRWADGHRVKLSEGNRVTTMALDSLGETAKAKWIGRFRGLYQNGSLVRKIGNVAFVHAAAHPAVWRDAPVDRYVENHAFFGEIDEGRPAPDKPLLSHRWVDSIPEDHVAVVGHEIRSTQAPVVQRGRAKGTALFLDTGCGKGGPLSSADFKFTETGMQLQNFNTY